MRLTRIQYRLRRALAGGLRAGLTATIIAGSVVSAPMRGVQQTCPTESKPGCPPARPKVNLAFIIDRSRSMANRIDPPVVDPENAGRGLTYLIEIEGVLRALRDPTVIPRDGSTAVTVVTFNKTAQVRVKLATINSTLDVELIAAIVERLKCSDLNRPIDACPCGDTFYDNAIDAASAELEARQGVRRVFLMSTDGGPNDQHTGIRESENAREQAMHDGVQCELNVMLMGLGTEVSEISNENSEFNRNKRKVNRIVFPAPTNDLPGATFSIKAGVSNKPGASTTGEDAAAVRNDFDCQANEFARITRRVLRSDISTSPLVVRTDADTEPDTLPSVSEGLSLRQAIEQANCNGGAATITFADSVKIIRPLIPLPALTAPDITIDGIAGCDMQTDSVICDCDVKSDIIICACDGQECAPSLIVAKNCAPSVTIDGTQTDTAGGEQHRDGILIRSNHDIVRGVKIINFVRAGVAIDPVCQFDIVGHNRVEGNTLENNRVAGVLVLDPPPNQPNAVVAHNVGNTILGNTILDSLDSATPIDLGGDGRTDNDLCDIDQGPNTLLNFPYNVTVTMSGGGVTVAGTVCDPTCETEVCQANLIGAVVEIFAVTRHATISASQSADGVMGIQDDPDDRVITGVTPLARGTTCADGSFSISDIVLSPTCGYTATVTDTAGNTSELMFPCAGFAKAEIIPKTIVFDAVAARRKPKKERKQPSRTFTIDNIGCAQLDLTFSSILRIGADVDNGNISERERDDGKLFSISVINPGGIETAFGLNTTIRVPEGQRVTFRVRFNPVIPHVVNPPPPHSANEVLPNVIKSELNLTHNGCGVNPITINLTAGVKKEVQLVNLGDPQKSPSVLLTRSGDEFTVEFFVFDSDPLDIQSAEYEFRDSADHTVPLDNCCADLGPLIRKMLDNKLLVSGQSFSVSQRFSNANGHPEVTSVRVTVHGSNPDDTATATGRIGSLNNTARVQSFRHAQDSPLNLLPVKLVPALQKNAPLTRDPRR